jgi:hypothetical protein
MEEDRGQRDGVEETQDDSVRRDLHTGVLDSRELPVEQGRLHLENLQEECKIKGLARVRNTFREGFLHERDIIQSEAPSRPFANLTSLRTRGEPLAA